MQTNSQVKRYTRWGLQVSLVQAFVSLCHLGYITPPVWMCSPIWKPCKPHIIGIINFMSNPLPSLKKNGGWKWSQASNCGLSFWWLAPPQETSRSPIWVTSLKQKLFLVLLSHRNLQVLEFLCQEPRTEINIGIFFLVAHRGWTVF